MPAHKALAAAEGTRTKLAREAWEDAFFDLHAVLYDTMSALALLSVAEGMLQRMEAEGMGRARPN